MAEDPNYQYTKDGLRKHLVLLEDHMRQNPCPDCVNKHLLAAEGYAEEGVSMAPTDEEGVSFFNMANAMRAARKKFNQEVGLG